MSLKFIETTKNGQFLCNVSVFDKLFDEKTRELPLCVLCITGLFRGGKSFFLNLVLRYLRYLSKGGRRQSPRSEIPKWVKKEGNIIDGYKKQKRKGVKSDCAESLTTEKGVVVSGGETPVTSGIDFVDEIFIIPDPKDPTRKMCILLMDTQGLWDPDMDNKSNGSIFGLSCTLSSYLIFNQMGQLSSESLSQLANLTSFSSGLAKIQCSGKKAFQQMTILHRDCKDIDKSFSYEEAEEVIKEKKEKLFNKPAYKKHTRKLLECFEGFDAMWICHPGEIDTVVYDGNLDVVNDLFFVLMGHFIEDIFMNIRPRIIGGENVTGRTFIQYALNFSELFQSEDNYPNSDMIMDAACDVSNCKMIDNYCIEFESYLKDYTRGVEPVDESDLKNRSDKEIKKIIADFQAKANGSDMLKEKNSKYLDERLKRSYKDSKNENDIKIIKAEQERKRLLDEALNHYCISFTDSINDNFCADLSVFDEAHALARNVAINHYRERRPLTPQVQQELDEKINIKYTLYQKKRKEFLMKYGQSVTIARASDMHCLDTTITSVIIEKCVCDSLSSFNISECIQLRQLTIRDGNFINVSSFSIRNLPFLNSIMIGNDCFLISNGYKSRCSFDISNCENLGEIEIGRHSFKAYTSFSLLQLPQLEVLTVGDIFQESSNFYNCSFSITSLPKLATVHIGHSSFKCPSNVTFSNLRSLKEILLGQDSFYCDDSSDHQLMLKDLPSLHTLQSNDDSFRNISHVNCNNVPRCDSVTLHHSFLQVSSEKNYQCMNCSRILTVMYPALQIYCEILQFLNARATDTYVSDSAREMIEDVNHDMQKYNNDVYCNRWDMMMDCKNWLDKLENAYRMDKESQLSNLNQERKNKGKVNGKRAGILAFGIGAVALALPVFAAGSIIASVAAGAAAGATLGSTIGIQDDLKNQHKNTMEKYSNGCDRDEDIIKKIQEMKNRYEKYYK